MICETCDKKCQDCIGCGSKLGDIRILFGSFPGFIKGSSILRLLSVKNTVKSLILSIKTQYPLIEAQLIDQLILHRLNSTGEWNSCAEDDCELSNNEQYYLSPMRLPHLHVTNEEIDKCIVTMLMSRDRLGKNKLTKEEIDKWIVTLIMSKDRLTKNKLTKEEFHRKCIMYAMRIYPLVISQQYINSRL
jgi:hypothetical protein